MMNQNKTYDFTVPQRQSLVVLILIIFKTIKVFFRQFGLPILITYFIGRQQEDKVGNFLLKFIIALTIFSTITSLLSYFRKKFYVDEDELIVNSGIFSKKQISIRFERIQSIGFEQNLLHRILGVKKIKIDTAGSTEKELELDGLDDEKAEALRELLLSNKAQVLNRDKKTAYEINEVNEAHIEVNKPILQLGIFDLIKAGLFENHLSSASIILAFGWYIYSTANQYGVDADDYVDKVPKSYSFFEFTGIVLIFILISVLISLVRTILNYYNLSFSRILNGFKIKRGLFNSITVSAMDNKIQTVGWKNSLLKKVAKIYDLRLKQANNKAVDTKESISIPGANINHIDEVLEYLYPNENIKEIEMYKVDVAYYNRRIFFSFLIAVLVVILSCVFHVFYAFVVGCSLLFLLPYLTQMKYEKLAYGFNDEILKIRGGSVGDTNLVTPIYKIQSIEKSQSPFQRKRGLVTLMLNNASGHEYIPYIKEQHANKILDTFIKKVETDRRSWM